MDIDLIIGIAGMMLLLSGFTLNLVRKLSADSIPYILLNVLGGGLSVYYAVVLDAVPFIILEAVWTGFALYKLIYVMKIKPKGI